MITVPLIAPSLLAADFSCLGQEIKKIQGAQADWIHLDIMDGHFVPNITFGPCILQALRPLTALPFDVHLMIEPVDPYLETFAKAGADFITFHPEASPHPYRTLEKIKSLGVKAGIALNPGTPVGTIDPFLDLVDLILVMTVNPGFGGQAFIPSQITKIRQVREKIQQTGRSIRLEVDGGITPLTATEVLKAGADVLVAGTFIFKHSSYIEAINLLKTASAKSTAV